jgi:methylated-DNA-[protein]-cysteine S-methyltransferase
VKRAWIRTPDGWFEAVFSETGLAALKFPAVRKKWTDADNLSPAQRRWLKVTQSALRAALKGKEPRALPPLDLSSGTAFQQRVWAAMRGIARGQTTSYGGLARRVDRPKGARAVGAACGANPIPLFVPCHRVLAAGARICGFSGGLEWKRKLLRREGAVFHDVSA